MKYGQEAKQMTISSSVTVVLGAFGSHTFTRPVIARSTVVTSAIKVGHM